jgi:hypothetical protein
MRGRKRTRKVELKAGVNAPAPVSGVPGKEGEKEVSAQVAFKLLPTWLPLIKR